MTIDAYPFVDAPLARLLEGAEAHANSRFVESRARIAPEVGACWMRAGGAAAMFDGVGSPLTQTFGLGLSEPVTVDGLHTIESFFESRGSDVFQEVSPIADLSALALLTERGYRPCELTSVMFRPLQTAVAAEPGHASATARPARPEELARWAELTMRGWSEASGVVEFMRDFNKVVAGAEDAYPFMAEIDGDSVASGLLTMHDGVALLAGASTVPEARGRGAQRALLAARLRFAAEHGCPLAMMCAAPGSGSQRNAERHGFRIAYTRIKWRKHTQR
jgi:GNAT superfamily N-acetyltransferase